MTIRPCPNTISKACPCDDPPIANFSSEAPDTLDYLDREWAGNDPPPFFQQWNTIECGQTFVSNISQADAELQALAIVAACADQGPCIGCPPGIGGGPGRGLPLVCNQTQQSCVPCPDGTQFCYVIPAGSFCGFTNQARANSYAHGLAFSLARQKRFCLSNISSNACTGAAYNQTIVVTGAVVTPCTWTVVAGAMPPGLTFGGFSPNIDTTLGPTETIQGTPTMGGTFMFTVQCQGSDFSFMQKTYTICVGNIQPTSLPSGTTGLAYSQSLTENSGCLQTPLAWTVASGSLPPGLVFASSGTINGTPTTPGDYTFTVKKTSGSNSCSKKYSIHVAVGDPCGDSQTVLHSADAMAYYALCGGAPIDQFLTGVPPGPPFNDWISPAGSIPIFLTAGINANVGVQVLQIVLLDQHNLNVQYSKPVIDGCIIGTYSNPVIVPNGPDPNPPLPTPPATLHVTL